MRAQAQGTTRWTEIAGPAALMADPARAAMLTAMLDGRAFAAGELARIAGVSPATASSHLARLLSGELVTVLSQGRHRYYRLAGPEVAAAIEALSHLSPPPQVRSLRASRQADLLAEARTCYDHLAGRAGVALLNALTEGGMLVPAAQTQSAGRESARPVAARPASPDSPGARPAGTAFEVTEDGAAVLSSFGVNSGELRRVNRRFAGACLDWTERRPHLSGALGAAITTRLFDLGWIERAGPPRAVRVTPAGREGLSAMLSRPDWGR